MRVSEHPFHVLNYAARHDYPSLCDAAVLQALDYNLSYAYRYLNHSASVYIAWVRTSGRDLLDPHLTFHYS